jgi:hypothetical protein
LEKVENGNLWQCLHTYLIIISKTSMLKHISFIILFEDMSQITVALLMRCVICK